MSKTAAARSRCDRVWAVVALQSPERAKSRLRAVLTDIERVSLFFVMARRVIGALKSTPGIDRVLVVTACSQINRFASHLGVTVILQNRDEGTAGAFEHAVSVILAFKAACPTCLLMIPGDLPLASPQALAPLIKQSSHFQGVTIVPDHIRSGTNVLLTSPPGAIPPRFGRNSFRRHLDAAHELSLPAQVIESQALSIDIDVPGDVHRLIRLYRESPERIVDIRLRRWLEANGRRNSAAALMDNTRQIG